MGFSLRSSISVLIVCGMVFGSGVAMAQSAADKATARQLATEGIQLFQQSRYGEALDKLERAQALFDAPVHLVYIARCQVKQNKLIDAAENYRRLIRTQLGPDAPAAFRDAVASGREELTQIEPQIPSLRLLITPADAKDLQIKIDEQVVPSAVVGVDRPMNPGQHVIAVAAVDYAPTEKKIELRPGTKDVLSIQLVPQPGATVPEEPGAAGSGSGAAASKAASGESAEDYAARLGVMFGLRGYGKLVQGSIDDNTTEVDGRTMNDRFGLGGGGGLVLGFSIPVSGVALTPFVGFSLDGYMAGPYYSKNASTLFGLPNNESLMYESTPSGQSLDIGARATILPSKRYGIGAFGELYVVAMDKYTVSGALTRGGSVCEVEEEYSGMALGFGGGVLFAVSPSFALNGRVGVTGGQFSEATRNLSGDCGADAMGDEIEPITSGSIEETALHLGITLGAGAEFTIGL